MAMKKKIDANRLNLKDEVVSINRVTKVVKGGKNMSFAALVVKGLGFTRLNQIVEREDTPSIRGMVAKVPHLVRVVE